MLMKDKVLTLLKQNEGNFVSGSSMSWQLETSRMTICNCVKELVADGYNILSSTRNGYKYISSPNKLSLGELSSYLDEVTVANVICLEEVDSTNNYLKSLAQKGAKEGTVVIANKQTSGKGRLGNKFFSPKDNGVYLSYLYRPTCELKELSSLTARVAVAVARAIKTVCNIQVGVKWVNDLICNNKKVCGILTELSVIGENLHAEYAVVGIGINVNNPKDEFKGELYRKAGSLFSETKKEYDRNYLIAEIIKNLKTLFAETQESVLKTYKEICVNIGREIVFEYDGKRLVGIAEDLDDNFGLIARVDDRLITLVSGEVSVRGVMSYY